MAESTYIDDSGEFKSLSEYLSLVNRRKFHFLIPFILLAGLAVAVVMALPPIYRSEATILVESQQIPDELVRSTITSYADERIEFIKQKVLTRANISDIISKHGLYSDDKANSTPTELINRFREDVEINLLSANGGRGRQSTIAFRLAFLSEGSRDAQMVANDLVTLFLNENVRSRSERAAETTEFLSGESERIREEMQVKESLVAEFKLTNSDMLPELLQMNLNMMDRLESDYQGVSLRIEALESEHKYLVLQRDQQISGANGEEGSESLYELNERYRSLLQVYSTEHPDVKRLKRLLDDAEAREADGDVTALLSDPVYRSLHTQVEALERQLALLRTSRDEIQVRLAEIEQRIAQSPLVEKQYIELQRDLDNLTAKYQELKNKELEARISQNLEEDRKGERFALLEPPLLPDEPYKPNRPQWLVLGLALAGAIAAGIVVLAELMNPALRGQAAFARALGTMPLVYIPKVQTAADSAQRSKKIKLTVAGVALLAIIGTTAVHFLFMELDLLWYAVLRRLSAF